MKRITKALYHHRIMNVVDHIWNNINQDIDLNVLADVACFSPYHFHRIYREMMHETVAMTVKRLRLHHASYALLESNTPIAAIAKNVGYSSSEAFIRAFAQHFGKTPANYRIEQQQMHQNARIDLLKRVKPTVKLMENNEMYNVEIKDIENIDVVGMFHQGDYLEIGRSFEKLDATSAAMNLLNEDTRSFGIYYDDPESKSKDELTSHACISVSEPTTVKGLDSLLIQGGTHAVLTFKGPYADLETVYRWFYGEWLPESGYQVEDKPPFEEYLNDPKSVAPNELLTAIYVPIQK